MRTWQKIIRKTLHFPRFSVIFVWFLPLLVGFCHISLFFLHFCLFCSHLSFISAHWQDSLVEKLGTAAWQNTWPPLAGRNFGRKGLNFGRMKLLAPPKKLPRYAYGQLWKCSVWLQQPLDSGEWIQLKIRLESDSHILHSAQMFHEKFIHLPLEAPHFDCVQ